MGLGDWAARMALRREIGRKISAVQELINVAKRAQAKLITINMQIDNSVTAWDGGLATFQSSVMAPVVVTDKFEGESAQTISVRLPEPIAEMESSKASAQGVQGEIAEQLTKLEDYITKKEAEKAELMAQLMAI